MAVIKLNVNHNLEVNRLPASDCLLQTWGKKMSMN